MKEAYLCKRCESGELECHLCRHLCRIDDGKRGKCRVRINRRGVLYTRLYDKVVVACPVPIETMPLFHVSPGSKSFFVAALGVNFRRAPVHQFSTWELCRDAFPIVEFNCSPADIVDQALRSGCRSVAYSHTEPTIFYELARDTMEQARAAGLLNVWATNGYMTREMLEDSRGLIDAANVDLWAFNEDFYDDYLEARLAGVKDTLCYMKELGIWVEVTTVLIPGLNDDPAELQEMTRFIRKELGAETPWHVARYVPHYTEMAVLSTDLNALQQARQVGLQEGLRHVYIRNTPGTGENTTLCPRCSMELVQRQGGAVTTFSLHDCVCPSCGYCLEGIDIHGVSIADSSAQAG